MSNKGRPTKYSEEIVEKAQAYLDQFCGQQYEERMSQEFVEEVIPSIEGLADHIQIARSTLYEWRDQEGKEAFSDILAAILERQCKLLMNQGLNGRFNPNIAKLALGKHGFSDKSETDVTTQGQSLNLTEVERKAKIAALLAKGKANNNES